MKKFHIISSGQTWFGVRSVSCMLNKCFIVDTVLKLQISITASSGKLTLNCLRTGVQVARVVMKKVGMKVAFQ